MLKNSTALRKNPRDTERHFSVSRSRSTFSGCAGETASLPRWTQQWRSGENTHRGKKGLPTSKTHALDKKEYRIQPELSRRTSEDAFLVHPQICFSASPKPLLATCSECST
ncbi:MAG: uncharacterized protein A8A55_2791 [Amphiamblys sp. WSBS2006]|nr:MAG: uncharacterized protein A8A55_2791 [Amphiamblys sp. WSBS2006]